MNRLEKVIDAGIGEPASFARVRELQARGLYLQAYHRLSELAPGGDLERLTLPEERLMAARLLQHCGAPTLSTRIIRQTYRAHRGHPEAGYYYARQLWERRGHLAALRFIQHRGPGVPADLPAAPRPLPEPAPFDIASSSRDIQADWFALQGTLWAHLRDFAEAQRWIDRAMRSAPASPWIRLEQATIFEQQDRYADARTLVEEVLRTCPWYRPAVQHGAHLYQLTGEDTRALELLRDAGARLESAYLLMQLCGLEQELALYADARATLERIAALMPRMEANVTKWLGARRCDLAYWCGDFEAAAGWADGRDDAFVREWMGRLKEYLAVERPAPSSPDDDPPRRRRLAVQFVRQHHMTCVPATLSVLCRYWEKPADHLAIAEKICYDGTPHHKERQWADDNGFVTREFTLTWDVGVTLIDRGVPFILTLVAPERGHAQAVIGYDALRRTFLIRDPFVRSAFEIPADKMLEAQKADGPRCVAILPRDQAHRLDGLSLPDEQLYDLLYAIQASLERHDRAAAQASSGQLLQAASGHRIALYARRCLAAYDGSRAGILAATEELLQQFPDDENLQLSKLSSLRDLARRQDRIDLLERICAGKDSRPVFWRGLAEELLGDARESGRVERLLERCLRREPQSATSYSALASALWTRRQFEQAFVLYRIAACMNDHDERLAGTYFSAARHFRRTEEALSFLRERFARLGDKSGAPARTLFQSLTSIDRDGFAILEEALQRRPGDGELMTFAADAYVRYGREERGLELLARAQSSSHRLTWLYAAARIAGIRCRPAESLELWREMVRRDPLCMDAHSAIARLLAELEGRAAACDYLRRESERFPHHYQLLMLLILWERSEDAALREPAVRRLISIDPHDAFAHRELALVLGDLGRHEEALAAAEQARRLDPHSESTANVLASIHETANRREEAREWCRRAIRLSVDDQRAINTLMRLCDTAQERREELGLIQRELVRQVIFGDGLLSLRAHASRILEPGDVLQQLRDAHRARPDLWQSWVALVDQLRHMGELAEAQELGKRAIEAMPLVPQLWICLSHVHAALGEIDSRMAALQEAVAANPWDTQASRLLATCCESRNDLGGARRVLEQAVAHDPFEYSNHGYLAEVLWKLGLHDAAFERLDHTIRLAPDVDGTWEMLHHWGVQTGKPGLAIDKLREITRSRAGDPAVWRRLARLLPEECRGEALEAIERAIALEPRNPANYDLKARLLAAAGRIDDAYQACRPAIFGGAAPVGLRAREAWLHSRQKRLRDAIAAMEQVLNADPSLYWGWQCCADWHHALGDKGRYLEVCSRMAALWPGEPMALEYLAHAQLEMNDGLERIRAKSNLQRALEIDPDRRYAAERLFDLQLEDEQFEPAAHTLQLIQQQGRTPEARVGAVRLAMAKRDREQAIRAVETLARTGNLQQEHLSDLSAAIKNSAHSCKYVEDALARVALQPDCEPAAVSRGVHIHAAAAHWDRAEAIVAAHEPPSERWVAAMNALLGEAGRAKHLRIVQKLARSREAALRAHDELWGMMAYALNSCERWRDCVRWQSDWASRSGLRPWMLMNLACAQWRLGKKSAAIEAHLAGLKLARDHCTDAHLAHLACADPALFLAPGASPPVGEMLTVLREESLRNEDRLLPPAARLSVLAQRAAASRRRLRKADLGADWAVFSKNCTPARNQAQVKRFYRWTSWRIMMRAGGPGLFFAALRRFLSML